MGTVLTVDRLSFNRPGLPTVCRRSPNVCRRVQTFTHGLQTFTQCLPTCADVHPWFADVCRLLAHGSMVVQTAGPGIHGCADCWPWDPWLCTMLALGSMVVQTAGPGIHGCAPCWPWDPWLCIMLAHGSMVVHHAGPVGDDHSIELQPGPLPWGLLLARLGDDHSIELQPGPLGSIEGTPTRSPPVGTAAAGPVGADHSIELQPGPLGSMVVHHAGPGIHGCAPCWPMDPWLCTMLARSAMIDLPTIEGTPTRSPPVGIAAAGPVGARGNSNQVPMDTPVAVVLLPLSYFRFPTSQTHCERISERIANA
jgi:hypothetical protein